MKRKNSATRFSNLAPVRRLSLLVSRMPKPLRWLSGGSALSLLVWAVIATVLTTTSLSGLTPDIAQAAGVYTSISTDTYGNTHLAADSVTASSTYNLDEDDSSEDIQQQLGVDPNWRNGITRGSGALKFDGTDDYASVPDATPLRLADTTVTVEFWVKPESQAGGFLFAKMATAGTADYHGGWGFIVGSSYISFWLKSINNSQATFSSNVSLADGKWHHVAAVITTSTTNYFANTVQFYIDGVSTPVTSAYLGTNYQTNNAPMQFGKRVDGGFAVGVLDEVRISSGARYTSNFTPQRRFTEDANTTALYHFDETGQTVYDSSGNGYNGILGANSSVATDDPTRVDGAQAINQGFKGCSPDDTNPTSCSTGGRMGAGNLTLGANSSTTDDKQYEVQMAPSSGVTFDGTNDHINVGNGSSLSITNDLTIEAWVNKGNGNDAGLVSNGGGWIDSGYQIFYTSGRVRFELQDTSRSAKSFCDVTAPSTGVWHHIAVTWSNTNQVMRIFINGLLQTSIAGTCTFAGPIGNPAYNTHIGRVGYTASPNNYQGSIDEVRISNSVRYSSNFSPARRFKADEATAGLWHLDEATGSTAYDASGNGNTGTLFNGPTWATGIARTNPLEGDPLYYQYREVGGTWSTALPAPATSTQLGSTGIFLRFNPAGQYSAYDRFIVNSWAVEAPSTSSPQRGTRRSFPARAHLTATSGGLDIIDSATNTLWMRVPSGGTMLGLGTVNGVSAKNGRIYLANGSLVVLGLVHDGFNKYSASGNVVGIRTIAGRGGGSAYGTVSGLALANNIPTDTSVHVLGTNPPRQYVAVANGGGSVSVIANETAALSSPISSTEGTAYTYEVGGGLYSKVLLVSGGTLYAANAARGGVDVWTNIQSDTANQTTADRTYTTSSTPALRSNTVNSLSATVATSSAQTGSNTLAIGHDLGVDTIDEHSTQASSGIRYYTREGNTGTSGYNQKQFGGAAQFDGTNDSINMLNQSSQLLGASDFTIESWVKTTSTGAQRTFVAKGDSYAAGTWILQITNASAGQGACGSLILGSCAPGGVFFAMSGNAYMADNLPINDGNWHHVAITRQGTTYSIFVDGNLRQTGTSGIRNLNAAGMLYVGRQWDTAFWNGQIDEVRISNTTRYTANFTPSKVPFTTDANTVALYHFNERDGQTIYDSSANANNGTLGASSSVSTDDPLRVIPAISGASDKVTAVVLTKAGGTARSFGMDGSNDIVSIPNSSSTNLTGSSLTVSAWINIAQTNTGGAPGQYPGIINKGNGYANIGYELLYNGSGGNARLQASVITNSGHAFKGGTNVIPANTWTHVALVYDGSNVYFYINGVQHGSATALTGSLISASSYSTVIGKRDVAAGAYGGNLNGKIANVRQYSVGLSAADMLNLYNAERSGRSFDGYSGNLVGHWKLDERSGQTITDSSGSGNNGTFGATSSVATDDPTPSIEGPALTQSPTLWVATNGVGSNDGAVTSIGGPNDRQDKIFTTTNSDLPDLDVSTLSMSGGGLAFIGTENGGWSTGTGGAPELTNGERKGALNIRGATRITGAARISR